MRTSPNIQLAGFLCLLAIVILVMGLTHKHEPMSTSVEKQPDNLEGYVAKLELEHELELDEQAKQAKQVKLSNAKRNSVECQFWKQQKPSPKVSEKITQYCELTPTR